MKILAAAGGLVYLVYSNATEVALWKSDGTSVGTSKLVSFGSPDFARLTDPIVMGNTLFFSGTTQATGSELWKSDGTVAGTGIVRQIREGPLHSYPLPRLVSGDLMYFKAYDPAAGNELWRTDGTTAGTELVKDIYPDELDKQPEGMTVMGGNLYFSAYAPGAGREIWKSDGTPAGTALLKDMVPGPGSGFSDRAREQWTAAGNLLFCMAQPLARTLLRSDGTADGTFTVKTSITGPAPSGTATHVVVPFGNSLLFPEGVTASRELWRSDGTLEGTLKLAGGGEAITPLGQLALFAFRDLEGVKTLWKTDGTLPGTGPVLTTRLDVQASELLPFPRMNGSIYFPGNDTSRGNELWKSDGTVAGTSIVADLTPGAGSSIIGISKVVVGNRILFSKGSTSGASELWSTDGTSAGSRKLMSHSSSIGVLTPNSGPMGPLAFITPAGTENVLWASDGTPAGTRLVKNLGPKNGTSGFMNLQWLGSRLLFTLSTPVEGSTLWSSDGTAAGTQPILDLFPGAELSTITILGVGKGFLFFIANDLEHGRELWVSDGTAAGTRMAEDLNPGLNSSSPQWIGEVNGRLIATYETYPATSTPGIREIHISPVPVTVTGSAMILPGASARLQGTLDPDWESGSVYFEYGTTTSYGSQTPNQPRDSTGPVEATISGLTGGLTYHFRTVFVSPAGSFHGASRTFQTPAFQVFAGPDHTAAELMSGQGAPLVLPDTPEGTASAQLLTVRNASGSPVVIGSLALPTGYAVPANSFPTTLEPGGTFSLTISVLSSVPGVFQGQGIFQSDAGAFSFPLKTTVLLVNDPPRIAQPVDRFTPEDTAIQGRFTATDPDQQPLVFSLAGPVANGSAVVNEDGSYVFTPAAEFSGTAFLNVKVNDGLIDSPPVTLAIHVLAVADPPLMALPPLLVTPEDTVLTYQLSASSAEGKALTFFNLTNPDPATGSLNFSADGSFTFRPSKDYSGAASFIVRASDGLMDSTPTSVFILITPVNDPPVLSVASPLTVVEGLPVPLQAVIVSDPDHPTGLLQLTATSSDPTRLPATAFALGGSGANRTLNLAPPPSSNGTYTITLALSDGQETVTRSVNITILTNVTGVVKSAPTSTQLRFTGIPGLNYQIQRSTDLFLATGSYVGSIPVRGDLLDRHRITTGEGLVSAPYELSITCP